MDVTVDGNAVLVIVPTLGNDDDGNVLLIPVLALGTIEGCTKGTVEGILLLLVGGRLCKGGREGGNVSESPSEVLGVNDGVILLSTCGSTDGTPVGVGVGNLVSVNGGKRTESKLVHGPLTHRDTLVCTC